MKAVIAKEYGNGREISRFRSIQEAADVLGLYPQEISETLNGKQLFTHGMTFEQYFPENDKKTTKVCARCGVELPLKAFYKTKEKRALGVSRNCKECELLRNRLRRGGNYESTRPGARAKRRRDKTKQKRA